MTFLEMTDASQTADRKQGGIAIGIGIEINP